MRCLARNKRTFWYAPYKGSSVLLDENEYENGGRRVEYFPPVMAMGNISAASGQTQIEQFGSSEEYDRVIVLEDVSIPIDENTVLFVDKRPEFDEDGSPLFDYIVRRVARSLNSVSIAIDKVASNVQYSHQR